MISSPAVSRSSPAAALLAGCRGVTIGSGGEAAAAKKDSAPFRVIDLMPELFAYCREAEGLSPADARALFVRRMIGPHAEVYTPKVLRLPAYRPDALDRRLDAWLPTFPALVAPMRRIHDTFGLDVIARSQPNAKLSVLMHHELFHFYQDSTTDFVARFLSRPRDAADGWTAGAQRLLVRPRARAPHRRR